MLLSRGLVVGIVGVVEERLLQARPRVAEDSRAVVASEPAARRVLVRGNFATCDVLLLQARERHACCHYNARCGHHDSCVAKALLISFLHELNLSLSMAARAGLSSKLMHQQRKYEGCDELKVQNLWSHYRYSNKTLSHKNLMTNSNGDMESNCYINGLT